MLETIHSTERVIDFCKDLSKMHNVLYHPVSNDPIDQTLAEIFNKPERLQTEQLKKHKMLFLREGEGKYTYSNKKVIMKLENEKLVIRVGGGFMALEDFI